MLHTAFTLLGDYHGTCLNSGLLDIIFGHESQGGFISICATPIKVAKFLASK